MNDMPAWANEIEIPKQVDKVIGNAEVKTDQDTLNKNLSARVSENHKRKIAAMLEILNQEQLKKMNEGDLVRHLIDKNYELICIQRNATHGNATQCIATHGNAT